MMEEEKPQVPPAETAEVELEFRPWVKWCGLGLAGVASIGLFLATYYTGYSQGEEAGFTQATSSGMVQQSLNDAASRNILNFMRLSSATDEYLLQAASDTEALLGWVKLPEVRYEAEWTLACALLERGKYEAALTVLTPLFEKVPHSAEWAHRMLGAGNMLLHSRQYQPAATCFRQAGAFFAENNQQVWQQEVQGQLIALEASIPRNAEEALAALTTLLDELKSEDEGSRQLRSMALVHMGTICRSVGRQAEAEQKFKEALAAVENLRTIRPEGAVSRGAALLETGDAVAAEAMLRMAEQNSGTGLSDITARIMALRYLAVLEQQRGHQVTALAMLHRAQGMAEGRIHEKNAFWPCLYDQRGWMHFTAQNFQTALLDFNAALAATDDVMLRIQPLEGAARCYLELGKQEQAAPLMETCLELRRQHTPEDKNALGRLQLLMGQIYDQQGKVTEAESAYGAAVANLATDAPDEQNNRREALLGRAYAQMELKRWADAYSSLEQVLPLVETQLDRREEVRTQMRRIKPMISAPAAEPQPAQ